MGYKIQKERLEQELRFLKESFEAEVISEEEFTKGKERIERKLNEIRSVETNETPAVNIQEQIRGEQEAQSAADSALAAENEQREEKKQSDEAEKSRLIKETAKEQKKEAQEKQKEQEIIAEEPSSNKEQKESRFFRYSLVFVVLALAAFFSYSLLKSEPNHEVAVQPEESVLQNAEKINVVVLNDRKSCFNCDTQRVLSILESWFGSIDAKEADYGTEEGKSIAERFDAKMLPMYILPENITKNKGFAQFQNAFAKKGGSYVLSDDAAGSAFYIKRSNVPNKLDLFVVSGDEASIDAEKNIKEFLEAFQDVEFEKHFQRDNLSEELGIKVFPSFLINNRVKFSGVQAAETIKNNFCKLNKIDACEKSLSKSLV